MVDDQVVIRTAPRESEILELSYVLDAVGIPHRVYWEDGLHVLTVPVSYSRRAREELRQYDAEEPDPVDSVPSRPARAKGWWGAGVYIALILGVHALEQSGNLDTSLFRPGSAHAASIKQGEWWRTITALTLHIDIQHVAGNAVFGGIFTALLCRGVGNGVGWMLFLLSGALGNGLNVLIQGAHHDAVGASTGVFGVLGALAAWQWAVDSGTRLRRTRRFAPIVGSVLLLTYLGGGGEGSRVDVLAHVTGFVCGAALSFVYARWLEPKEHSPLLQGVLIAGVFGIIGGAWLLAL